MTYLVKLMFTVKGNPTTSLKDESRGLALSSLKPEDAVADYSALDEKAMVVPNDWHLFVCSVSFTLGVFFYVNELMIIQGNDTIKK